MGSSAWKSVACLIPLLFCCIMGPKLIALVNPEKYDAGTSVPKLTKISLAVYVDHFRDGRSKRILQKLKMKWKH